MSGACNYSTTREDPVSIIFYGWGYADRSVNSTTYHFGWGSGDLGQYFASHGNCEPTSHASAGPAPEGRYHIRIKKTTDGDPGGWEITSASTPHRERDCPGIFDSSHGVYPNGFVEGAERIIDGLYWRADHGWAGYQYWGNTQLREPECGGDWWATFDGYVGFVYQHYSFH